jgi:purine-binding chemotaxis protein CheW
MEVAAIEAADDGAPAPAGPQWVIAACSGQRIGIPLERVREIVTPRPFTRLPGAAGSVAGLIAVRTRIVTAYDLGLLLGVESAAGCADHRILLVDEPDRVTGLVVDEVLAAAALEAEGAAQPLAPELAVGVAAWDARPVTLLDLERVFERLRQ